jgi:class 3 adenylate cyclase/tetratricopeptide (TPR) repeat protein
MRCRQCGRDNPSQARYCLQCGARLALRCARCGVELPEDAGFCFACGQPVVTGADPRGRYAAPGAAAPLDAAETLRAYQTAVHGERKLVTVLFADVKGSMDLLADRDPEEARRVLDPVLERMMEAVRRYGGTVNQVLGDGIMALFGAPLAYEDHAVRACHAALAMQTAIRSYAEAARRAYGLDVQIRVGLNSGEVVVRAIDSDIHTDYSAIGQTTHLAARMEHLAAPGSIRLTADTVRLAEGFIQARSLGPVAVKGLPDPVEVFELIGVLPGRTRIQAAAARGLTRFVGRQGELAALGHARARARAGRGEVLSLVGEPGVGKSRLIWELTHSHWTEGWLLLEGAGVSFGKATAYRPLGDLLRGYFQIEDRDDAGKIVEKLRGKVLVLDPALESLLPAFLALLDVPAEDAEWLALDPPQRRRRTIDAFTTLVLRESEIHPVLLIVEDLHWTDTETQALLDTLVESLPAARLLLLVSYRPEHQHRWANKTYYTQLRVDPLPREGAEELLASLLGDDRGLEPFRTLLIDRTEGNPFFLEEIVRTLVETGALVGERGAYRLGKPLATIQVPATVQAILASRIDRLPAEEKALLQAASVIGKNVPLALLQAVADLAEPDLRRGLGHLQAGELLYEANCFPDREYVFKHALTHEVAYAGLLKERRQLLHARIVEAVEALYPGRLIEHVERLGHHAALGEVWEKAWTYLRQAGAKAFARSANQEAVACFEESLFALRRLPESRETIERAIDLWFDLRNAYFALGDFGHIFESLREAERLAEAIADRRRLGAVRSYLTASFMLAGDFDRAIEEGHRAIAIADEVGQLGVRVVASFNLCVLYHYLADYRRSMEWSRQNIERLEGDLVRERFGLAGLPAALSRTIHASSLIELGRFAEALTCAEEGVRIAEAVGHPYSRAYAGLAVGYLFLRKGELEPAIRRLEQDLALCRATDIRFLFPFVASFLGSAYTLSGRVEDALPLLERAVEAAGAMEVAFGRLFPVGFLSEAMLAAGRTEDAAALGRRALDLCRTPKVRGWEAWTLRMLGEIGSRRDPAGTEEARAHYGQALSLAQDLGMRPLIAHCHVGLGRLARRAGRRQDAEAHIATATGLFREMGMRFWLERTEAEFAP